MFALKPILGLRVANAARSEVEKPWRLDITTTFYLAIQCNTKGPGRSKRFPFFHPKMGARQEPYRDIVCPCLPNVVAYTINMHLQNKSVCLSISSFVGMDAWM